MKGKWNDLLKTFHTMDKNEDGTLCLEEFKKACERMGLGMSDFQVHRLFTAVSTLHPKLLGSTSCAVHQLNLQPGNRNPTPLNPNPETRNTNQNPES